MDLCDLVAPLGTDGFMQDHYGRAPIHIPGDEDSVRRRVVDWVRFNHWLTVQSHWSDANIKVIMNSRAVASDFYMDDLRTLEGSQKRASAAKLDVFMGMGASIVGNAIELIDPDVRDLTDRLAAAFGGVAGANVYGSFSGVQAFASHCDPHEVFAIQGEGEKVWRIYENRADNPLDMLEGPDAQAIIDAAKGRVAMEVTMRPGDLLYIPRGFYHDALASDRSLHLTLSVAPHSGRILFRLLEDMAIRSPAFRAYLPDAVRAPDALRARLDALAGDMAAIVRTDAFFEEVATRQAQLARPGHRVNLPERQRLDFYARTEARAHVSFGQEGARLVVRGEALSLEGLGEEADWLLGRPAFSVQELHARYLYRDRTMLDRLVQRCEGLGLISAYQPQL